MALQHLRASTADKRPTPAAMADGQLAMNTNLASPGLFFKDSNGDLVKAGPVHVGTTAPNATPASGGQAGNSKGEQWLDTSGTNPVFKIWDGSAWQSEAGEFVNASGDTMTGALVMDNQQQIRFRETTANGTNFIALQAPASVASDKTITLPDVTGTVVTTGDTGSVTSTMILDGTILNADVNASAAIAGTKISPDFGSQNLVTTGTATAASLNPTGSSVPTNGVYLPAANSVAISTNGVQRINIEADGDINIDSGGVFYDATNNRLAIGTTSPSTALHVTNSTATNQVFIDTGGANSTEKYTAISSAQFSSGTETEGVSLIGLAGTSGANDCLVGGGFGERNAATSIKLYTASNDTTRAGTERARIDSSGRVLIGTSTSPSSGAGNDAIFLVQGYRSNPTLHAIMSLQRGEGAASITSGEEIANINFGDSAGNSFAWIQAFADANAGSGDYPGRLVFSTTADGASSPTERMRIDNAGNAFVGTTSGGSRLNVGATWPQNNLELIVSSSNSSASVAAFVFNGTGVGNIICNSVSTAYATSSDYRLKENVVPLTGAIDRVNQLQVHRFNFIADSATTVDGFIAHEAQEVVPECVTGQKDEIDAEGNPIYQGIDQSKLVPLLTAALQEAIGRIETLEAEVAALEAS